MNDSAAVTAMLAEYGALAEEKRMYQQTVSRVVAGMTTGVVAVVVAAGVTESLTPAIALPVIVALGTLFAVIAHTTARRVAVYLTRLDEDIDEEVGDGPKRWIGWEGFIGGGVVRGPTQGCWWVRADPDRRDRSTARGGGHLLDHPVCRGRWSSPTL